MNRFFFCVVLFFLLKTLVVFSQKKENYKFHFENFNLEEGLSFNEVNAVAKDSSGFIWIGTAAGLNRFDGYEFVSYFNPKKFRRNRAITQLQCDKKRLWIGTQTGLFSMLLKQGIIEEEWCLNEKIGKQKVTAIEIKDSTVWCAVGEKLYQLKSGEDSTLNPQNIKPYNFRNSAFEKGVINRLKKSSYGLWVGASNYLALIDEKGNAKDFSQLFKVDSLYVSELFVDSKENLWVAMLNGVFKVDLKQKKWKATAIRFKNRTISDYEITAITEDKFGNIYLGSDQKGLMMFVDGNIDNRKEFIYNSAEQWSIADNDISTLYTDDEGIVWVGFKGNGFDRLTLTPNCFRFYESIEHETNWLGSHGISSIIDEDEHRFWASSGTSGGGVFRFDKKTGESKYFYHPDFNADKYYISYLRLYDDILWVNYKPAGLHAIDIKTGKFTSQPLIDYWGKDRGNIFLLKHNDAFWMTDSKNDFVQVFPDKNPQKITELRHLKGVTSKRVKLIDSKGNFWMQTDYDKLIMYNPESTKKMHFEINERRKRQSSTYITCIAEHVNGTIWVGTSNGISIIDPVANSIRQIKRKHGQIFDIIYNIVCDDKGFTWVTTNNLLACIYPNELSVAYYGKEYGIENCRFNFQSNMKSEDGTIYLGTENKGIVAFSPDKLTSLLDDVDVKITALEVNDQPVLPWKGNSYLEEEVAMASHIDLKYNENSVKLKFAALSNYLPNTFRYAYRLKGEQSNWQYSSSTNRSVNFSNLTPGNYTLLIKAAKSNGEWTAPKQFVIKIQPPWWATRWAYCFYFIVSVSVIWLLWRYSLRQVALKEQLKLERTRREHELELNNAKLKFFTNISHEFRTPLTLLLGQLELLLINPESETEKRINRYKTMQRNSQRLLRLINQILDFRKVENRTLRLQVEACDLASLLAEITIPFEELASQKGIDFSCVIPTKKEVFIDADKVEKVLHNLLSNALKFTETEGCISVELKWHEKNAEIIVKDSGIGISEEDQKNIFKRFYQVNETGRSSQGTGIGLAYSSDLATLMHGSISVESEIGQGSCFSFQFPVALEAYSSDELAVVNNEKAVLQETNVEIPRREVTENSSLQTILVIDDELDVRELIKDSFKNDFNYLEAANGQEGLKIALEQTPDLIISDVMMPVMDGVAFCEALRKDIRISHIPVILLTARTQLEHQIEGIDVGADSYITKPFSIEYLQSRVSNLITLRNKLREKYSHMLESSGDLKLELPNRENEFIERVKTIIEENMADSDFRIENIYKEIGMSRTHFFKKIKALTDKTANEFIKSVKMRHAAHMLIQPDVRINEVAWAVGFADPKYFTKVFKSFFGATPSEFVNEKKGAILK